jgi:2,3,4,5-tetrahydropyridine-2,6-dicarboxylate N-succinyltransferase
LAPEIMKMDLQTQIEGLFTSNAKEFGNEHFQAFDELKAALNDGRVRAAEPDASAPSGWKVNAWVKKGILLGFRIGRVVQMSSNGLPFYDKHTLALKKFPPGTNLRIVPGGSSIRDGVYLGRNVTCMPPMYVNVGAHVDDGTLIDSHALVGSCAQIGKRCHLSAAAQIGGVLEPIGALPVIIEDDVLVGGNCGVYEGTVVKRRAVLGSGVILTRSTPVYDLIRGEVYSATEQEPLVIPEDAVVVPGSRAIARGHGKEWGISLYTPVIVKYRDSKTEARIQREDLLR